MSFVLLTYVIERGQERVGGLGGNVCQGESLSVVLLSVETLRYPCFLKNPWCSHFAILGIPFQNIHLMIVRFLIQNISPGFMKKIFFENFNSLHFVFVLETFFSIF